MAADGELAALLSRHGIRPVEPPTSATDFHLADLDGAGRSLSDSRGSWLVLTFFATWCAPCVSEMPTLERLHELVRDSGVQVLGVSVDADRAPLQEFVGRLQLSFPILWDQDGTVASIYRADSIPLSYLIDPQGRIVGVARGARDWAAVTALFDRVLELIPTSTGGASSYVADGGGVSLPAEFDPPTAALELSTVEPQVGQPFFLDVHIRWAGNFDDYLLHPPEVSLPDVLDREALAASSSSEEGRNVVTYRLTLRGRESGSFALTPVELRYTPRLESTPLTSRITGPTIHIRPVTIAGLRPGALALVAGGAVLGALLGGVAVRRRRRRPDSGEAVEDFGLRRFETSLEEARRMRLQGDVAGCVEALARLELDLNGTTPGEDNRLKELRDLVERVRFGGEMPSPEELDKLQRRVERLLGELRPDRQRLERDSLQLRDSRDDRRWSGNHA